MAGEAQQLSFMQGEISPEFYYRSDLASFNSSLSKASNVKLGPLGGLSNRKGSKARMTPASIAEVITNLQSSNDYVACVFQHYITKQMLKLEVFNNQGVIKIYCAGVELDTEVCGPIPGTVDLDIAGDVLKGLKGLHFIIHNDLVIFSKTLPLRFINASVAGGEQYVLPIDDDYSYTETQFCIRMVPPDFTGSPSLSETVGIRLESNLTLQNMTRLTDPFVISMQSTYTGAITGSASYALVAETADGNDVSMYVIRDLPGTSLAITMPASVVANVIPYPISGTVTNYIGATSVSSSIPSFGSKEIVKLKVYRTTGVHTAYNSLYKLVAKFGVDGATAIKVTDGGQEEPAYSVCCDTSALYQQPSFHTLCTSTFVNTLTGGLKTVVDTAVFQQRAYYAINKGLWWGTSVYNNTIVASRISAVGQVIFPQISNPTEAFQFNVPEERGGFLTHLASMSRLVAFTNTSTFIIQGDEAGIITPTSINPFKVLSFGCMEGVPPVVSGDTCLFASTGGGVGYLTLASDGGAVGGNASALAGHMFENKTILSIVPIEDRKSLPRFLINTTAGDLYECYKVGEVFSFFRVEMLGAPTSGKVYAGATFPMTVVHAPSFAKTSFGAEAYTNYRMLDTTTFNNYVVEIAITPEPLVQSKYIDYETQLDFSTELGSFSSYVPDQTTDMTGEITGAVGGSIAAGWVYKSAYSVVEASLPHEGHSLITNLADPTGDWLPNTPIEITEGLVPLDLAGSAPGIIRNPYMKFTWLDDSSKLQTIYARIIPVSSLYVFYRSCTFEFDVEVPLDLQTRSLYLNPPSNSNIDTLLSSGYIIAELAFDKVEFAYGVGYGSYMYAKGFYDLMLGYDVKGLGTIAAPIEVPITLEVNGNIYGNFKDPLSSTSVMLKHYYDAPPEYDGSFYPADNYFEIELPELCSWFSMGAPAIGEMETLPVASAQQDITDARKNIDYASVLLYNTKGLRVGEVGQPDIELERFDFTTEDSVTEPVAFSGPKSYNFGSTWNDHGKVRVSGMDLQPFSISGIIPKGNVGAFNG